MNCDLGNSLLEEKYYYCFYTKTAGNEEWREPLSLWNSNIYIYIYIYMNYVYIMLCLCIDIDIDIYVKYMCFIQYSNWKCSWKQLIRGIHEKYIFLCMHEKFHAFCTNICIKKYMKNIQNKNF